MWLNRLAVAGSGIPDAASSRGARINLRSSYLRSALAAPSCSKVIAQPDILSATNWEPASSAVAERACF